MVIEANMVIAHAFCMANATAKLLSESTVNEMRPERIGRRLMLIRLALGLKPAEMADMLGIERTYWSRFENGRRAVSDHTAALLVERFGISLDYLVLGRTSAMPIDLMSKIRQLEADGPPPSEV